MINGFFNGGTYVGKIVITFNEGIATLNGNAFLSGSEISATGNYLLNICYPNGYTKDYSLQVMIKGDINGDGRIDIIDLAASKNHLLKRNDLFGVYGKAADMNSDNKVTISDLISIKKILLGI